MCLGCPGGGLEHGSETTTNDHQVTLQDRICRGCESNGVSISLQATRVPDPKIIKEGEKAAEKFSGWFIWIFLFVRLLVVFLMLVSDLTGDLSEHEALMPQRLIHVALQETWKLQIHRPGSWRITGHSVHCRRG